MAARRDLMIRGLVDGSITPSLRANLQKDYNISHQELAESDPPSVGGGSGGGGSCGGGSGVGSGGGGGLRPWRGSAYDSTHVVVGH